MSDNLTNKISEKWDKEMKKGIKWLNIPESVIKQIRDVKLPHEFAQSPYAKKALEYGLTLSYECLTTRSNLSAFLKSCMTEPSRDILTDIMWRERTELTIQDSIASTFSLFQTNIFPHELQAWINIERFAQFLNLEARRIYRENEAQKSASR